MDAKKTLDALLKRNRGHEKTSMPGKNNHVPMVLIALYRLGGSPEQMHRYVDAFDLTTGSRQVDNRQQVITLENWQRHLGQGEFSPYVEFFDGWMKQSSMEAVLRESVSVLMKGVSSVAYHALLRLGYALDYGSRDEVAHSLAYWASAFYPGPAFDAKSAAVEPDASLADMVKSASKLYIKPINSIDGRILQVYSSKEIAKLWKPIRLPDSSALDKMSALILETFTQSQHFTLLHALTSCQALRFVLPYLSDPKNGLSHYWHSVCAAYLTVYRSSFEVGKDNAPNGDLEWQEVLARAAATEPTQASFEHTIKLTYACWLEFQHYKRPQYLALASREIRKPSSFV